MSGDGETVTGDLGRPDVVVLREVRDYFERNEPLVEDTAYDDPIDPQTCHVHLGDGVGSATWARLDVKWYSKGMYHVHHVDEAGVNWRFDRHDNPHSPQKHFHEPPDAPADNARDSCITVEEHVLVVRAVHKRWRHAYEEGSHASLNEATNPP